MPRWWSRCLWWRPPFLDGAVVINLAAAPDEAIRGVCLRVRGPWVVLHHASLCKVGGEPAPIDGEVVIHRTAITFVQLLQGGAGMAVIYSAGALQASGVAGSLATVDVRQSSLASASLATYAAIYRTQPNVRTVIDFLARNVAQLPVQAFRRVSDNDRVRLADHEVIAWLTDPNPGTTRYRLFEALMQDLGIYATAYWLKIRRPGGGVGIARIPPEQITVNGWLLPTSFIWTLPDGRELPLAREQVVYFTDYDPDDPIAGLSPLETLRQVLLEDAAQTTYRRAYWQNSARLEGVVERPAGAPRWTTDQKQAFREQWQARFGGGHNAGQTAVLEDGMTFKPTSYSARDSEFIAARKLTAEEVARAYHVPLPMVGILDHATFSNIREQHKQLYQDSLGPRLEMIVEELERQLLVDAVDRDDVYLEFNINAKLQGSFEEQARALQVLVGRPVMTANEGRARLNLPSIENDPTADALALPLNTSSASLPAAADDTTTALAVVEPELEDVA